MPYTESELKTSEFYQEVARRDEKNYKKMRDIFLKDWIGGQLRDSNGTIILFEEIIDGEGSTGNGFIHQSQKITIDPTIGYFGYDKAQPELDNIIDRKFSEL